MTADLLVRVVRSGFVESEHHGHAVALDADGNVVASVGDPSEAVLARSALKPLFAVGMVRAGLDVNGHQLALAQASHSGEGYHLDGVRRLLATAGLDDGALRTTPDRPLDPAERSRWSTLDFPPSSLAHNCSGKHAAMLVTCVVNGWDLDRYLDPDHPLQLGLRAAVADLAGESVAATAVDGCGAPVHALSLTGLARAFSRIATASADTGEARVARANRVHPEWVGGTGRYVTELARAVPGLVVKDGAEAVCAAALPDGRTVAVKILDGSERALRPVLRDLLRRVGEQSDALDRFGEVPVLGHGRPVGTVESALGSPDH